MKSWIAIFVPFLFILQAESLNNGDSVLLQQIQVITLYKGRYTSSRRASPVLQLQCLGGSAGCGAFLPDVVQCYNKGWDGVDVQWECKTDMDNSYRFGKIEVSCEGFNYPEDPYVLKGSCGLEYSLELTEQGRQKGRASTGGFGSGFFQGSSSNTNYQSSGGEASGLLVIAFLLLLAYGVYKMFLCGPMQGQQRFPDHGSSNAHTGAYDQYGGAHTMGPSPPGFKPDYTDPPPSYSDATGGYGFKSDFTRPPHQANSGPGFWTGMGTGGVLGYLFGSQRSQPNVYPRNTGHSDFRPTPSPASTGTRSASGFGGTKRR
ncbi:store-operated calcium entry-associated regulatory factor isoform X2 [Amia ocellicauda]|uniref:store-operated calcium entry-associated regulatory factor isoform X2 n=1 Tax=Amia ocellicauda TaxID=2972642 RepID=UPI0034638CED